MALGAVAALLGRFLPRLRPLAREWPFFLSALSSPSAGLALPARGQALARIQPLKMDSRFRGNDDERTRVDHRKRKFILPPPGRGRTYRSAARCAPPRVRRSPPPLSGIEGLVRAVARPSSSRGSTRSGSYACRWRGCRNAR